MSKREMWELQQMQALPLSTKISLTQTRIREWVKEYGIDGVYVSCSFGKDSLVLLDIARKLFPKMVAVYCDTGLEFPSLREFATMFMNVEFLKPSMHFVEAVKKYGYPIISKEVCEVVYGARRYLDNLDRQTDRQTDRPALLLLLRRA